MSMNASARTEVLRQRDQVKEHRGYPGVTLPPEVCVSEPSRHGNPVQPDVPDEAGFPSFIHGAGI
jgi:hypothetical protein